MPDAGVDVHYLFVGLASDFIHEPMPACDVAAPAALHVAFEGFGQAFGL
jgi:hypothetical protein